MADSILLVSLALAAGAALALAPVEASIATIVMLVLLRRTLHRTVFWIAAVCLLLNAWRARAGIDGATRLHARVTAVLSAPARCEGEAIVISSPVVYRQTDASAEPSGQSRLDVELLSGHCGERLLEKPLRARLYGAPDDLSRGDRIAIVADIAPVHLFLNEGLRDPRPSIARSGIAASGGVVDAHLIRRSRSIPAMIDWARSHARRRIVATFHPEAEALARALVLGETDLRPEDDEAFRASGLSHLLAVSGTHLVLAVAGFASALRALLVRIGPLAARCDVGRIAAATCIPASWIYADFAGGSGSAIRAAGMLTAAMGAQTLGRRPDALRALGCSLLVPAVLDPLIATDVSFVLSAAATAGLIVLNRPIAAVIVRGPSIFHKPLQAIATTLAAMIGCTPWIATLSPTLPVLGILANLFAAPIGEVAALPICLAHTVLWWAPSVERGAALLGSGALLAVRAIARITTAAGGALSISPPTPLQLGAIAVAATAVAVATSRIRRAAACSGGVLAFMLFEAFAVRTGNPHGLLRIHALDVGQGDAYLIDLPDGGAMLVDGGGFMGSPVDTGLRVVLPVLRAKRRSRIDVAILSHPHPDHFGGLVSTLPEVNVGEFWDTGQGEDQGAGPAYAALLRGLKARKIPVRRPDTLCGEHRIGGAKIEVLAPCPGYHPDWGANDNSFVIRISYGSRSALLVGDAEHEEEAALTAKRPDALRADLLKIGHHGSRTSSTPSFLNTVSPAHAIISCGVRNRYGHPSPSVLDALAARGIELARTDRGGEVIWETDGESVTFTQPLAR